MSFRPTPNPGPAMFETQATVTVPTASHDSSGAATYSGSDTTNVPCSIQPASSSESQKYGGGLAHQSDRLFVGYFPVLDADGTALSIPASAKVTADGVTYYAAGAGNEYSDGIQQVPLGVQS